MNSLRKDLIKLAYAQPELRADLLPLLKSARGSVIDKQWRKEPNGKKMGQLWDQLTEHVIMNLYQESTERFESVVYPPLRKTWEEASCDEFMGDGDGPNSLNVPIADFIKFYGKNLLNVLMKSDRKTKDFVQKITNLSQEKSLYKVLNMGLTLALLSDKGLRKWGVDGEGWDPYDGAFEEHIDACNDAYAMEETYDSLRRYAAQTRGKRAAWTEDGQYYEWTDEDWYKPVKTRAGVAKVGDILLGEKGYGPLHYNGARFGPGPVIIKMELADWLGRGAVILKEPKISGIAWDYEKGEWDKRKKTSSVMPSEVLLIEKGRKPSNKMLSVLRGRKTASEDRYAAYSAKTKKQMNAITDSKGKTVTIEGEKRKVKDVRWTYGNSISLTLDKPLKGRTSPLYTVDPDKAFSVKVGATSASLKFSNLKDLPKVYADASAMTDADLDKAMENRKLKWRSNQWVSLTAWHKAMKGAVPFGYNDFDADKVFRWLKKYAGKGNLELQAAREYSPALYIKSDDPDLLAQIEKSGRRGGGAADESDIRKDGVLRLWWD